MSTQPTPSAIPEIKPPTCPHCKVPMVTINGYPYQLGSWAVLAVYCTSCSVLLGFQIFPATVGTPEQKKESPLWKPS